MLDRATFFREALEDFPGEYYEPDPEIVEAMKGPRIRAAYLSIILIKDQLKGTWKPNGFRFGDPRAWPVFRFGKPKKTPGEDSALIYHRQCGKCHDWFLPKTGKSKLCRECSPGRGRPRLSEKQCRKCGRMFCPTRTRVKFCGLECGRSAAVTCREDIGAVRSREQQIVALFLSGKRSCEIAVIVGVSQERCRQVRRKMGLPRCKPGPARAVR
jgi:hypothetical protein